MLNLLLLLLCGSTLATSFREEAASSIREDELVPVPGVPVRLAPPNGFTPSSTFSGFQHAVSGSSLLVFVIPAPYEEVVPSFTDPRSLRKEGMKLLADESERMQGRSGRLLLVAQEAQGDEYRKWIRLFGSDEQTAVVMGTFPAEHEASLGAELRSAVLSAAFDARDVSPTEGLGFSLGETGTLQLFQRNGSMLCYTEDGAADPEGTGKALFVVGPGFGPRDPLEPEAFARMRLRQTEGFRRPRVESTQEIRIDGLDGLETIAEGVSDTDVPTVLYQVVLFDGASYWIAQGLVRGSARETFLPLFRQAAKGFRREWTSVDAELGPGRISIPTGWASVALNEQADLQVGHETADCYLMVFTESRADLDPGFTLAEYSAVTREGLTGGDEVAETSPHGFRIDGRAALQVEIRFEDEPEVVYLHTVVEGEDHFHQLMAWTVATGFERNRAAIDAVIESFREAP